METSRADWLDRFPQEPCQDRRRAAFGL